MTPSRRRLTALAAATTLVLTGASTGVAHAEVPPDAPEQLRNGDFSDGTAPWFSYGTGALGVTDGQLCTTVPGGLANPWDAGIGQDAVPLIAGAEYELAFDVSATPGAAVKAVLQLGSAPYTTYASVDATATGTAAHVTKTFTAPADNPGAQLIFQVGGSPEAQTFCLDNVSLRGGEAAPPYEPDTGPRVRVNQVGYLPGGPKNGTVVTAATDPLPWQLKSAAGTVVADGETTPRGVDPASGQNVQTVDFSAWRTPGTGYTLTVDGETSHPFDISGTLYQRLRADSLQFFYAQRSGTAIDGDLLGAAYARPAGHLGVAPNQGDTDVPCQPDVCDYRLDVRGGWYDAGDHGKYVVNGGIATYQLLNAFERTKTAETAGGGAALGDATLRVPERGNKVPDILDEARWELEFLLRMQVPAGQPLAGMAHHKIHDKNWTGLPLAPQDDPQPRELHPPSTAATLNLAAVAAQCARLFAPYDAAFAARCGAAAKTAYAAAKAHPAVYASAADGNGGGAYEDSNVTDEFYWAAVELWLTTGDQAYLTDLTASPLHTADVFDAGGAFGWQSVAALGRLDLATVPNALPAAERTRIRASVTAAADRYLATLRDQAYGLPLPGIAGAYVWGSNSNIVNNAVVLATAFDLTRDAKYRNGAVQTADYLLGRNALNMSYVTGWGEQHARNQHSRIFAHQLNPDLPNPPAGSLAGGANAGIQDPFAANLLAGCAPMFCYVDDINSYSTNEIAINWNSALAWLASFLADQGAAAAVPAPTCAVTYTTHGSWSGGFTTQVTVRNTGTAAVNGWNVRWAFTGDQKVDTYWLAKISQSGATVTAKNESYNATIAPGASITFGLNGLTAGGPNPNPTLVTLNGTPCTVS
ncbi:MULTISPECIES: glycoside hydrolase family 9 protein [Micromonospora]|uniref:Endoglucanase n=1 Tax=Micromonospora solifontis TaxID=2487138 RepID=A0ABX9WJ85_9ACTN|nr:MULTISPECIES: glycoside hydrolase family 9 protein [Micromonospora]NES15443.1 glycosyl hydrolase family 5 [Micromonospora sp. PPF5-17B]NES35811.1 glycosyl hydrolase family 5 [Micromonospora solifontis]NES58037.1 glycosyl hydrolase family 5 [Micromonospora sp. PPF5-6]RNM00289.1 glycosyl hydrolase family 5 [Micromonospora solifontis]